jgi:hypothetical protein
MNIRRLSRIVMLTGLVLTLTACTGSPAPQAEHPPTVSASTLTSPAQLSPTPSPSPFGGASAQLGSLPLTCPSSSIHMPKTISPQFAPAVGAGPAWGVGISSYQQVPLALVWDPGTALTTHEEYGWGHKLLWVVATHLQGAVTIHGTNLRTGTPVYPDAEYAEASSTPAALILNPSDPTVVSQDANRDDQWTQFPGGLTVPGAGCYSLEATWPGGSWHLTFAAGLVPSPS